MATDRYHVFPSFVRLAKEGKITDMPVYINS